MAVKYLADLQKKRREQSQVAWMPSTPLGVSPPVPSSDFKQDIASGVRNDRTWELVNTNPAARFGTSVVPKPTVATPSNPVMTRSVASNTTWYNPPDYSGVSNMDKWQLQDYIDYMWVQSQRRSLTDDEKVQLLKAQRLLSQPDQSQQPNPYDTEIQNAMASRDLKAQELAKQWDTAMANKQAQLDAYYSQQDQNLRAAGNRVQQAAQWVLSFSWFGRSTYAAEKQAEIQQWIEQQALIYEAEKAAALERARLEQQWASEDVLANFDKYISDLQTKKSKYIEDSIAKMNDANKQFASTYEDKVKNILEMSNSFNTWEDVTPEQQLLIDSYSKLIIDKDGNVDTDLLKQLPSNIVGLVLSKASSDRLPKPNEVKNFWTAWSPQFKQRDGKWWVDIEWIKNTAEAPKIQNFWTAKKPLYMQWVGDKREPVEWQTYGGWGWWTGWGWGAIAWASTSPAWSEILSRIKRVYDAINSSKLPRWTSTILNQNVAADIAFIKNNLMFDTYSEAKKRGVSFWQMTNAEWNALKSAWTSLKPFMSKDALNAELNRLSVKLWGQPNQIQANNKTEQTNTISNNSTDQEILNYLNSK